MNTSPNASIESLLAHEGWDRSLAFALVRDTAQADDFLQRAFQAALRRPPDPDVHPKRWLATVLRNRVRFDARSARHQSRSSTSMPGPKRAPRPLTTHFEC
jgi:DNA-directed RNA polymerase specialized sigma24 family protein